MKKYVKSGSWAGIILLLMGMVFGCNDLSEDDLNAVPEKPGTGRVTIKLTDAPFPAEWVEEANISIDWVQLLKYEDDEPEMDDDDDNGNGADNGNGNDDDNGEGDDSFVMLDLEDTLRVNLLDLRNGVTQVLAEADIPAGTYRQIRLHVVEAGIVLDESLLGAG